MTFTPSGTEAAAASATVSLNPAAAGNIYVLFSAGWSGGGTGSTPYAPTGVSGGNCTWSALGTAANSNARTPAYMGLGAFLGVATATGASSATVSFGGSPSTVRSVAQQFSVSASAQLDGSAVLLDTSAANSVMPSLTPAAAGELYIGYEVNSGTTVTGSAPGFTYQVDPNGNGLVYNQACGTGEQAPAWGSAGCAAGLALLLQQPAATFAAAFAAAAGEAATPQVLGGTPLLYAGSATGVSGSWADAGNATGSAQGTYATWTDSGGGSSAVLEMAEWGGSPTALQDAVPAGSVITDVRCTVRHGETPAAQVASMTAQAYSGAAPVGDPQALTIADDVHEDTVTFTGVAYADLADLRVRVTVTRN